MTVASDGGDGGCFLSFYTYITKKKMELSKNSLANHPYK